MEKGGGRSVNTVIIAEKMGREGCGNADIGWQYKGRRGVGKILTLADKGGGGFGSPFLVDMICEQPLTRVFKIR